MDLDKYSLEEIFLTAIRAEMDSKQVYHALAKRIENVYMKDKILFLAEEEEKHRAAIEKLYKKKFPNKKLVVPRTTPVPLRELALPEKGMTVSVVLENAMKAEQAAQMFYEAFSTRFSAKSVERKLLLYFSNMELGHFRLIEADRELMAREEWFDTEWPMMHAGP
jgi:rubrerythrin